MKLISRLTTALMFSVVPVGFGISGNAETVIDFLDTKELSSKVFQSDTTIFEANNNKQNGVKQSSQEIIGNWIGTNSNGIEVNLLLQNDNSFIVIFTASDRTWKYNTGSWSVSNNLLALENNDGSNLNTDSINWVSNDEFVFNSIKFRRTDRLKH